MSFNYWLFSLLAYLGYIHSIFITFWVKQNTAEGMFYTYNEQLSCHLSILANTLCVKDADAVDRDTSSAVAESNKGWTVISYRSCNVMSSWEMSYFDTRTSIYCWIPAVYSSCYGWLAGKKAIDVTEQFSKKFNIIFSFDKCSVQSHKVLTEAS